MSGIRNEAGVKSAVKKLLNKHGWYFWMPPGNGYGTSGVSDFNCIKDGVFLALETKFGYNKPTALQVAYAGHVIANDCFALCVNETMLGVLDTFLESFAAAALAERKQEKIADEDGARMLNAIDIMTDLWGLPKGSAGK